MMYITDEEMAEAAAQKKQEKKEKTPCFNCSNAQFMRLDTGEKTDTITQDSKWHEYDGVAVRIRCNFWREFVEYPSKIIECDGLKSS